jgi:N-acylneuraminate cytidylyltransferase
MRWLAYMPLRGGSKSIPGKNIRPLAGKPLFTWALAEALASGCFEEVWAGTDSLDIRRAVEREFPDRVRLFERSAATCTDAASTESALLEFMAHTGFDVLCTVQATAPLTRAGDFRAARRRFLDEHADSLLTATRSKRFYWNERGEPLNYDPAMRPRRQDFAGTLMENGAFYFTTRAVLIEHGCRLGGRISIYEMPPQSATELDEPGDWAVLEALLLRRRRDARAAARPRIRGLVVDVDGTLTDGGMYYGAEGEALKKFNTRDAHGLLRLERAGIRVGVITAEQSASVDARMRKLGIAHYFPGAGDKLATLQALAANWGLGLDELAYMGDDLNDLGCLQAVGCACCPADAAAEVRACADHVTEQRAGAGAVREICELLLAARSAPV